MGRVDLPQDRCKCVKPKLFTVVCDNKFRVRCECGGNLPKGAKRIVWDALPPKGKE